MLIVVITSGTANNCQHNQLPSLTNVSGGVVDFLCNDSIDEIVASTIIVLVVASMTVVVVVLLITVRMPKRGI